MEREEAAMIYILEDDESIRKLVVYGLESQGFTVEGFALPRHSAAYFSPRPTARRPQTAFL